MKMYVDEMPSCCGNCGFCCKDNLGYWCQAREVVYIADKTLGEKRLQSCPLQSLAEYGFRNPRATSSAILPDDVKRLDPFLVRRRPQQLCGSRDFVFCRVVVSPPDGKI